MKDAMLKVYLTAQTLRSGLLRMVKDERGQDLIEYALVVALIAFAATVGMSNVATKINDAFSKIGSKLDSAIS